MTLVLAINPGSVSTKVGLFSPSGPASTKTIEHTEAELARFSRVADQKELRLSRVRQFLDASEVAPDALSAIVGRGGLLRPLQSGTYLVNERMIRDLEEAKRGEHASNLGGPIAAALAKPLGIPAFVVDPVSVDELAPVARISGLKGIERTSLSHALNTKAVAKRLAREKGRRYPDLNLVVAHLGSGISVSAHTGGRMIDVANPLEEGPFSPDRAGGLPTMSLIELCYSGRFSLPELRQRVFGEGGIYSYLGTRDLRRAMQMVESGDSEAKLIIDAMVYQTAKEIGAMATVLSGKVDWVILTGGMAKENYMVESLTKSISFIAPVVVCPGEDELTALAEGAIRVLRGEEQALTY